MQTMETKSLIKEETFHDEWAQSTDIDSVMVDEFFEACTSPENRIIIEKIWDLKWKKILELGCWLWEASVYFAKKWADVMATDLSTWMLELVWKVAKKHDVQIETCQCLADNIPFKEGTFDMVYAANLLHHVDIDKTLKESSRVLKKWWLFISWDPLAHNPAINIYRKRAMWVRTEDEHPIRFSQIKLFKKHFSKVWFDTTRFFTLWIFIKFYFFDKVDPNKERYRKKILVEHKRLERTFNFLYKIDRFFLKIFPFMKRFCRNIVFICKK